MNMRLLIVALAVGAVFSSCQKHEVPQAATTRLIPVGPIPQSSLANVKPGTFKATGKPVVIQGASGAVTKAPVVQ